MQDQKTLNRNGIERLPEPSREQINEALEIVRRALGNERIQVWSDSEGRLCWMPIEEGDVRRAG